MSAERIDPGWGDDWMAIADATREAPLPHPELAARFIPHPSHAVEFTNLALEITLGFWADEILAEVPIALVPVDHLECSACGEALCGCDVQCEELQRDACSHYGQPYCASCAPYNCADCGDDARRWERPER